MKSYENLYTKLSTNVRLKTLKQPLIRFTINTASLLFPKKTKSVIRRLFFRPHRQKATEQEQNWMQQAKNFQIRVNHKTIQCWKWGDGPQILSVHGWDGIGIHLYRLFQPLLQDGYSVIAFDAPAHGSSEGKHTNYFEITDTVRALVHKIGKQSLAGLIAHSVGGAAVINCLSKEEINTKTVLIAPALKLKELLHNTIMNIGIPKQLYDTMIREIEDQYGYSLLYDNPYSLLNKLNQEVMIIHDQNDKVIPFQDALTIAGQHRNIALYETQGFGHKYILKDQTIADAVFHYMTNSAEMNQLTRISA